MPRGVYKRKAKPAQFGKAHDTKPWPAYAKRAFEKANKLSGDAKPAPPAISGDILTGEERTMLKDVNFSEIEHRVSAFFAGQQADDIAAIALVGAFTHWFDRADAATKRRILKSLIDSSFA